MGAEAYIDIIKADSVEEARTKYLEHDHASVYDGWWLRKDISFYGDREFDTMEEASTFLSTKTNKWSETGAMVKLSGRSAYAYLVVLPC